MNVLPPFFSRTYTLFLPKRDDPKKLQSVTGYRPATPCYVEYRTFERVLAARSKWVITVIDEDHQTCGIRRQSIQTNTRIAWRIPDCCVGAPKYNSVAMIQADLAKAFDRLRHNVLYAILLHVVFGKIIIQGVTMACSNCTNSLIINRKLSEIIHVRYSVC